MCAHNIRTLFHLPLVVSFSVVVWYLIYVRLTILTHIHRIVDMGPFSTVRKCWILYVYLFVSLFISLSLALSHSGRNIVIVVCTNESENRCACKFISNCIIVWLQTPKHFFFLVTDGIFRIKYIWGEQHTAQIYV